MLNWNIKWMDEQLPLLVSQGLISQEQSQKIFHFYHADNAGRQPLTLLLFGILGSILIAGGIILLFAHNWHELPRLMKVGLSFLPLLIAQALAIWLTIKKTLSIAWKEGVATFGFLSVGVVLGLISQTYNIDVELHSLLAKWLLLGLPFVYFFRSTSAACFYLATLIWYLGATEILHDEQIFFWLYGLLILPFHVYQLFFRSSGKSTLLTGCFFSITLILGIGFSLQRLFPGFHIIMYLTICLGLYSLGKTLNLKNHLKHSPYEIIGFLGFFIALFFPTYQEFWNHHLWSVGWKGFTPEYYGYWLVSLTLLSGFTWVIINKWKAESLSGRLLPVSLLLCIAGSIAPASLQLEREMTLLFNLYVLILGVTFLTKGIRNLSSKTMNTGFAIVAILILLRFFDTDFTYLFRGLAFMLIGVGFLAANYLMTQKKAVKNVA